MMKTKKAAKRNGADISINSKKEDEIKSAMEILLEWKQTQLLILSMRLRL
jgi:hypothetical protein